jgi:hypothetical protein
MLQFWSRRIAGLALLPFLILSLGFGTGGWHCSDGTPCEPIVALACCCGEAGIEAAHACEEPDARTILTSNDCGCYYDGAPVDAAREPFQLAAHPVAVPPSCGLLFLPPAAQDVGFHAPAGTGSPPRYLVSSRYSRAPPTA